MASASPSSANQNTMVIPPALLNNMVNLLSPECMDTPFTALTARLGQFSSRPDAFKVGLALQQLLRTTDLLSSSSQRLTALVYIYELFKNEIFSQNPFSGVFLHYLHPNEESSSDKRKNNNNNSNEWSLNKPEKDFISNLIVGNAKDMMSKTPRQISSMKPLNENQTVDLTGIQLALAERVSEMPSSSRSGAPLALADPRPGDIPMPGNALECNKVLIDKLLSDEVNIGSFDVQPLRPVPPLWLDEETPVWISPTDYEHLDVHFDISLAERKESTNEAKRLMSRALKSALTLSQQQQLKTEVEKDPSLIQQTALSPADLPDLVENNPLIAVGVLLNLMDSAQITDYLSVLVNMEMSLHSMEVVNRLVTAVELPTEFVHMYISNCISTCETIKDKYMQNRLVRLLCVFLQSLIRNKIINVQDLFIEVQAFCIEFSRIREAAALFRLLKQLESGELPSNGPEPISPPGPVTSLAAGIGPEKSPKTPNTTSTPASGGSE